MGDVLAYRYKIVRKLGEGAFGKVYEVHHIKDPSKRYVIKTEQLATRFNTLTTEKTVLKSMRKEVGFPKYHKLIYFQGMRCLVIELLGKSLEAFFFAYNNQLPRKTTIKLISQVIKLTEKLHRKSWLHRDIKPLNVMLGHKNKRQLYLIDFGCAKSYIHRDTGGHIDSRTGKCLVGTPRFASINSHLGLELSRRDDLVSIGYMLAYFVNGSLPWSGISTERKASKNYTSILKVKQGIPANQLFLGQPQELSQVLDYCYSLRFDQEPDYAHLYSLLRSAEVQIEMEESCPPSPLLTENLNLRSPKPGSRTKQKSKHVSLIEEADESSYQKPAQKIQTVNFTVLQARSGSPSIGISPSNDSVEPEGMVSKSNGAFMSVFNMTHNLSVAGHCSIILSRRSQEDELTAKDILPEISQDVR